MVLSTKARRVSVGARAGNARRSALRPRMRGAVPERGPGRPGRGPVPKEPGSGRRRKRGPGLRPEGRPERPTPGNSVPKDVLPSPKLRGAVARGSAASRTRAEDTRRRLGPGAAPKAGGTPTPGNVLRRAGLRVRATRGATGEQSLKARLRGLPAGGPGTMPQDSATGAAAPGMPTRGACPVPREPGIHAREGRNADAGNAGGTQAGAADSGGSRPRHPPRETRETARGRSRLGPGSGTHARGETSTPKSSGKRPKLRSSAPLRACLCRGTGRGARPKICFGARASEFRACRGATGGRVSRL